jgi:hypothetical protein
MIRWENTICAMVKLVGLYSQVGGWSSIHFHRDWFIAIAVDSHGGMDDHKTHMYIYNIHIYIYTYIHIYIYTYIHIYIYIYTHIYIYTYTYIHIYIYTYIYIYVYTYIHIYIYIYIHVYFDHWTFMYPLHKNLLRGCCQTTRDLGLSRTGMAAVCGGCNAYLLQHVFFAWRRSSIYIYLYLFRSMI